MVGPDAKRRFGPQLNNIIDAPAGAVDDFKYSKALLAAASDGLVWDFENLGAYLENPKRFIPKTKMSFRGLREEADRSDVIAYLATFSEGGVAGDVAESFRISSEILAIVGDLEFVTALHAYRGKYLDNSVMQLVAGRLTDEEIAALAAYFRSLEN